MFLLPDVWTWDAWFVDDGHQFHAFYLKASRALLDPHRRHERASVGHAVSADLRTWTEVADALVPSDGPAFDDLAIWTGSVLRGPDGVWRMFYTGRTRGEPGMRQRVGVATSADLLTWRTDPAQQPVVADEQHYELFGDSAWDNETWRDPWVFPDPHGAGWHMLVTARAQHGELRQRGVVGHATSTDLETWRVEPALSEAGAGFGQLEVLQVVEVDGRGVLLFSCLAGELADDRLETDPDGGIWSLPVDDLTGPFDISQATRLTDSSLYAGRLVQDRSGTWNLLAFVNHDDSGEFVGGLCAPIPVAWIGGVLTCERSPARFAPVV
ncbi:glycosyl hydrolase family 32 [Cellulomonas sp. URHD0024]|uniref:glycosyl hydrolase family 32 n=1 Tax=Cellulomonas sp. URHD0024 TaxID=1302620 RepID=UPI000429C71F|nr:glycosyl hydrolase family 32 [Cellulomonas sp. URHD0024]